MKQVHEQDEMTVRDTPAVHWPVIGWLILVLIVAGISAWEWKMRSLGLRAGDLDDSKSHWAVERQKIVSGDHDGVAIVGGSRILFDTDLDAWQQLTGRRPVQLALPGMSGQRFLADLADHSDFSGLVVIDVTPEQFFREGPGNPEFEGVLESWDQQGPAERIGHQLGLFLSRHLAFLDDQYALPKFIDQLEVPDRAGVIGPYLRPWKLSEAYDDRQHVLWREIETNERLRHHAMRVWVGGPLTRRPPPGEELVARICADVRQSVAKIRARGGDVAFIRPPSAGEYYEREQRRVPRAGSWDRLLRESGTFGIHFEDYPEMQDLDLPEMSHLSRESASRFTRAYVAVLKANFTRLGAEPVLSAPAGDHG
jgi:hypothetical protein